MCYKKENKLLFQPHKEGAMRTIVYYNMAPIHEFTSHVVANGTRVNIMDLVAIRLQEGVVPDDMRDKMNSLREDGIDPVGIERAGRWENLMSSLIFCLSGQVPLRQEVLRGRQIMMALPRELRTRENAEKIAFSVLPYVLVGFKTHLDQTFQADSNTVLDAATFITNLYNNPNPIVRSFLCAHRGKNPTEKHVLIDSVPTGKAQIALNLTKGVLANDTWATDRTIRWYQQGPTEWASLNMFPEMFLNYMTSGRISLLLNLIERHFVQIQDVLASPDLNKIDSRLENLDAVTLGVLSFLEERYGQAWRFTDFSKSTTPKDGLVNTALEFTLPEVVRMMPFYRETQSGQEHQNKKELYVVQNIESALNPSLEHADLIRRVIHRFFETQVMHPTAKALYETAFYYLWGQRSRANKGEVAIGIDRDHNRFQRVAWGYGYDEDPKEMRSPLLYARRNPEKDGGVALADYCVRQFWR